MSGVSASSGLLRLARSSQVSSRSGIYSKQNDTALTQLNGQSNGCGAISVALA